MHPNLVGSPGFQFQADQAAAGKRVQHFKMGYGGFPCGRNPPPGKTAFFPGDGEVDASSLPVKLPLHHRQVAAG